MELPFYVEERREKGETRFNVRPLFIPGIEREAALLGTALNRAAQEVRELFAKFGGGLRHDELLAWTFCPEVMTEMVQKSLLLRHTTVQCRLMVAMFNGFGEAGGAAGRVAFSPTVPGFWFEVRAEESLQVRAVEAYTAYFKAREKEEGADFRPPAGMTALVRAWVTTAEFHFSPAQKYQKPKSMMAALMGEEKMSGQKELQRVGRRLDSLYPEGLGRAALREREVAELHRLMTHKDMRPLLLVGQPLVGKSTIVQEYVYRRRQAMSQPAEYRGSVWLVSPQRLISGMMYAGQWENRLLAILAHLRETEQVLYLDDLPGLYHAGISAQSDLSAAQVLRPYVERRDVRVLAEITPQALRALRERDRGFTELFHTMHVREQSEAEARRVVISVVREQEAAHGTRFGVAVVPTVLELQDRYVRELALPGKAALVLKDLAAKYQCAPVGRDEVLREFHLKSGMSVGMLDRRARLERADVEKALRAGVVGQEPAVRAIADVVSVAKAQLNDTGRPLGSFLFVGPTGVGKTQAAKALAKYLFGDADRLIRFDMNEYLDPYAAQRLVGTWDRPEGLLTSAVRRRPFGVVLLDEIEKADPAVFDLLLQVLGEGRLSDALGRTADFSNAIIVMTSNLGVREAQRRFGFDTGVEGDRAAVFRQAAKEFFRPEFFNRIDRIVPFEKLTRGHTREIADELIAEVLSREGLQQRKCMLTVSDSAMERIVDVGYHPDMGARALKRAIERQLTQPVAARLAAIEPGTPTLIEVFPAAGQGVSVRVRPLPYVDKQRLPELGVAAEVIGRVDRAMDRIHERLEALRPKGRLTVGAIAPEHVRYFAIKEQFEKVESSLERFERSDGGVGGRGRRNWPLKTGGGMRRARVNFRALLAAQDLRQHLDELAHRAEAVEANRAEHLREICVDVAVLEAMVGSRRNRLLLVVRVLGRAGGVRGESAAAAVDRALRQVGWRVVDTTVLARCGDKAPALAGAKVFVVEHPAADALAVTESGVHLVVGESQELYPVQVTAAALDDGEEPAERVIAIAAAEGRGREGDDLEASGDGVGAVLRLVAREIVDLRTGLICPADGAPGKDGRSAIYMAMVMGALPFPPELEM